MTMRTDLAIDAPVPAATSLAGARSRPRGEAAPAGLARLLVGGILGAAGFWWAPITVDALSGYDQAVFGATLFLFIGWTFINIHHYVIDNVMRRRGNREARWYLFTASGPAVSPPSEGGTVRPKPAAGTAGSLRSTPTQGAMQS